MLSALNGRLQQCFSKWALEPICSSRDCIVGPRNLEMVDIVIIYEILKIDIQECVH